MNQQGADKKDLRYPQIVDSAHLSAVREDWRREFASDEEVEAALRRFEG
jgi:hypothetical protein